jgi:hypothetical protein
MIDLESAKQEASDPSSWHGFVLFLPFAGGTKSEGVRPYLLDEGGERHRLHADGDNPFENETIRPLHRCYCEVQGQLDEKKNLIRVSRISEIDDPFQPPSE